MISRVSVGRRLLTNIIPSQLSQTYQYQHICQVTVWGPWKNGWESLTFKGPKLGLGLDWKQVSKLPNTAPVHPIQATATFCHITRKASFPSFSPQLSSAAVFADDFSFSPIAFASFLFSLCSKNLLLPMYFPMNNHSLTKQGKAVVSKISCQCMLYDTTVAKKLPPSSPLATSSYIWNHPLRTRRTHSRVRCLNRASRIWPWNFVIRADTRIQRGAAQLHLPWRSPAWKVVCIPRC